MSNINAATKELHRAFSLLNKQFFKSQLPEPAITIQTSGKRLSMGWCSSREVWSDKEGKIRKYELNISAEYLNIEFMETMDTMLHEMIHLYNAVNGVKDTSRNGTYHNKKFKAECENRGFYFPDAKPNKKYGWAFPKLKEETKTIIGSLDIRTDAFIIARRDPVTEEEKEIEKENNSEGKKKKSYKWVCPGCGVSVRSTKERISINCGECLEALVLSK
ncbi:MULTISPECIES: SprT-like domain-containing protein [Bacilli]|uniref:SprT-like domain-containing protein n=1 Tax=Bacilli TaxID=91061 RepID=UPI002553E72A|nr:SprT-like domain-containing protein [Streptococcus agalactiae]MDK8746878.1 SprT-like domain-containing protein [Streptococcus agalactiae]